MAAHSHIDQRASNILNKIVEENLANQRKERPMNIKKKKIKKKKRAYRTLNGLDQKRNAHPNIRIKTQNALNKEGKKVK